MKHKSTLLGALLGGAAALAILAAVPQPQEAKAQASQGNYTQLHPITAIPGATITNTAAVPATINSADQTMPLATNKLSCTFTMTAHASSPSTTIAIQGKHSSTGQYYTVLQSAAVTGDNAPVRISVGPDIFTTANIGAGEPVPQTWRIQEVIGGTGTATGSVTCNARG